MIRRPPRSTPFPYPPLFRSRAAVLGDDPAHACRLPAAERRERLRRPAAPLRPRACHAVGARAAIAEVVDVHAQVLRSEEHTSELQSRQYLVCRLLLEKKKKK